MLRGAYNQELYRKHRKVIVEQGALDAYFYLIGWASTLGEYECFPDRHGYIPDFRFVRGRNWDFAFIPNKKWLLFYFRKPALRRRKHSKARVVEHFPDVADNGHGELTLRVRDVATARRLASYIDS